MPPAVHVLAADPDPTVHAFLRRILEGSGYAFTGVRRAEEALRRIRQRRPDVFITRVELPDMSGREAVALLRSDAEAVGDPHPLPVLLTALRGQEDEVSAGLEEGAVNVLFFPFSEAEFSMRLGALLRWSGRGRLESVLRVGPVTVDLERGELLQPVAQPLTASELEIMRRLFSPPGRAVTRRQIPVGTDRAVDVHVAALRSKLGPAGQCIETLRGIGYRFKNAACL
jgi:two-component system alkaline phosphatase synthesis response regulator PhoP